MSAALVLMLRALLLVTIVVTACHAVLPYSRDLARYDLFLCKMHGLDSVSCCYMMRQVEFGRYRTGCEH